MTRISFVLALSFVGCSTEIIQISTPNSRGEYVLEDSGVTWKINPNEVDPEQGVISAYSDWDKVVKAELWELNCRDDLTGCQEEVLLFSEHLDPWIWTEDTQMHTLYVCEVFEASVYEIHLSYDENEGEVEFYNLLGSAMFFIGGRDCYPEAFDDRVEPP